MLRFQNFFASRTRTLASRKGRGFKPQSLEGLEDRLVLSAVVTDKFLVTSSGPAPKQLQTGAAGITAISITTKLTSGSAGAVRDIVLLPTVGSRTLRDSITTAHPPGGL